MRKEQILSDNNISFAVKSLNMLKHNEDINIENLKRIGFEEFGNNEYALNLGALNLWWFDDDKYFEIAETKVYFNTISEIEKFISHFEKENYERLGIIIKKNDSIS